MRKAFTLVELLVAVVLLTLLIGTALFSYRQVLLNITKAEKSTFNEVLKVHQIRTSIESMQYYVVDNYNQFNQPMKQLHHFFNGNDYSFSYISLNPNFSTIPSLSQFECKENQLIYTEEPLYGRLDLNRPEFLEERQSVVYWDELLSCKFSFFLFQKRLERLDDEIPFAIQIDLMDANEKEETIFITIKSDYNLSNTEIHAVLYDE